MRTIAAFVCVLALASATIASAAPMPWKLFNEPALLRANTLATPSLCNDKDEIFIAGFKTAGAIYVMAYEPVSGRIVFTYGTGGAPTEIGFGTVNPLKNNEIPTLQWRTFRLADDDVCLSLFPTTE